MQTDAHLLGAFTSPSAGPYPPYVNVSEEFDRSVTIYIRGPARPMSTPEGVYPVPGVEAAITLSAREFKELLAQINEQHNRKPT